MCNLLFYFKTMNRFARTKINGQFLGKNLCALFLKGFSIKPVIAYLKVWLGNTTHLRMRPALATQYYLYHKIKKMKLKQVQENFFIFVWILSFFILALIISFFLLTFALFFTVDLQKYWANLIPMLIIQTSFLFIFVKWTYYSDKQKKFHRLGDLGVFLLGLLVVIVSCWLISSLSVGLNASVLNAMCKFF